MIIENEKPRVGSTAGQVISVSGPRLVALIPLSQTEFRVTVGQFMALSSDGSTLIGLVNKLSLEANPALSNSEFATTAEINLIGEFRADEGDHAKFYRGISIYPAIGEMVHPATRDQLRQVFDSSKNTISIGQLQQNGVLEARVCINEMLAKHFAILGTTGVGKSCGVALLLNQIVSARKDLRVLLLDVHNEYGLCFGNLAQTISPSTIRLPFWLFNFEEIVDIVFGGRSGFDEEVDLLSELIPHAKASYAQYGGSERMSRPDARNIRYTTDVPLPYRMSDLITLLDTRMGKLENRSSRLVYHKLIARISAVSNDPRYAFMFENANVGGDTMEEVLSYLFRLPLNGVPISVLQLAGFPSEVVDSVVSVMCRMAFDLGVWSDGANPLLIVCEEAHRYMSADNRSSFGPTRRSISRIAKEGRKYNVSLGLVSQRPAELDATIISQCSTLFVMRMTNDRDQEILQSAVTDTGTGLLSFIPSLGTGEVFAFGEGVSLPTRFTFSSLPPDRIPRSNMNAEEAPGQREQKLSSVIERWRGISKVPTNTNAADNAEDRHIPLAPSLPTRALDPDRYRLLKKPLDEVSSAGLVSTKLP